MSNKKEPTSMLQLLLFLIAGLPKMIFHSIKRQLNRMLILIPIVIIFNTIILVGPNEGFARSFRFIVENILLVRQKYMSGIFFWLVFPAVLSGFLAANKAKQSKELTDNLKVYLKYVQESSKSIMNYRGQNVFLAFMIGLAVSFFIAGLTTNPIALSFFVLLLLMSMSQKTQSLIKLMVSLSLRDFSKLLGIKNFSNSVNVNYAYSGLISGSFISVILTALPYFFSRYLGLFAMFKGMQNLIWLLCIVAIVLVVAEKNKTTSPPKAAIFTLACIVFARISMMVLFADDGGWMESGGTLGGWIVSEGASVAVGHSIITAGLAVGSFIGADLIITDPSIVFPPGLIIPPEAYPDGMLPEDYPEYPEDYPVDDQYPNDYPTDGQYPDDPVDDGEGDIPLNPEEGPEEGLEEGVEEGTEEGTEEDSEPTEEEKQKAEEEKRKAEEEKKKAEEEAERKKQEEERKKQEEERKRKEELEQKRRAELAEKKRLAEEARKRKEYEAWKKKRIAELKAEQLQHMKDAEKHNKDANFWGWMEWGATAVKNTADMAVDGLSKVTGPYGKAIKAGYDVASKTGEKLGDAYANDKSMMQGLQDGLVEGSIDAAGNYIDSDAIKAGYNVTSEMAKEVYNKGLSVDSLTTGAGKGTMKAAIDYGASKIPGVDAPDQLTIKKGYGKMSIKAVDKMLKSKSTHNAVKNLQGRVANATIDAVKGKLGGETTNILNKAKFGE